MESILLNNFRHWRCIVNDVAKLYPKSNKTNYISDLFWFFCTSLSFRNTLNYQSLWPIAY